MLVNSQGPGTIQVAGVGQLTRFRYNFSEKGVHELDVIKLCTLYMYAVDR